MVEFFQEQLGYRCLASEMNSFPVDLDLDSVENCRVQDDADVLVLVIGERYGYCPQPSSKSVTILESLVARSKGSSNPIAERRLL